MNYLSFLFILILLFFSHIHISSSTAEIFSGVYSPNLKIASFDFAAAWLVSREHFVQSKLALMKSYSMAGATFSVVRNKYWNTSILVPRDILDFCVEHLSSFSNHIPKAYNVLFDSEIFRMSKNIQLYRENLKKFHQDKIQNLSAKDETLVILVYSSNSFSTNSSTYQSRMRYYYFMLTFLSAYKYFNNIYIFVASNEDKESVLSMNLPQKSIINLNIEKNEKNTTITLPRESLLYMVNKFETNDEEFKQFRYVYYSEGDQIVHIRNLKYFYDLIDDSFKQFIIVPHRIQTLPVAQSFDEDLKKFFPKPPSSLNIPGLNIIEEDAFTPRGSCCEDGYYKTEKCKGWWYQCPEWGVRDIDPWFKFGPYGFTAPTTTEHALKCNYSKEKILCKPNQNTYCADVNYSLDENSYVMLPKKKEICYSEKSSIIGFHNNGIRESYYTSNNKSIKYYSDSKDMLKSDLIFASYYSKNSICLMNFNYTFLGNNKANI